MTLQSMSTLCMSIEKIKGMLPADIVQDNQCEFDKRAQCYNNLDCLEQNFADTLEDSAESLAASLLTIF